MESIGRFDNWYKECEEKLNEQINIEYWASIQYHAIAAYFDRDSVGLDNIATFFNNASLEERGHADILMKYQNKRGGKVQIDIPLFDTIQHDFTEITSKSDALLAFEKALDMENVVYRSLLKVHNIGEVSADPQFTDFIESEFLEEQIKSINELSKYVAQLRRIRNNGHGVWNFNREFKN